MTDAPLPPPPPDDKDWTWVLERPCDECGFDPQSFPREEVPRLLRENTDRWAELLARDEGLIRSRPRPDQWSALEYGAHVRDVHRLYLGRLRMMLDQDGPHYPNWDQDVTAVADRYDLQDPATVAGELATAGEALAAAFDAVDGAQWERTGYRSDGAAFTVESFARYFIHDPVHHVWDVEQGYRALA